MKDRFDLEQAIMELWHTAEDINTLYESYYDGRERWTEDRMANALLGLAELVNARGDKCMHIFEQVYKLNAYAGEDVKAMRKRFAEKLMEGIDDDEVDYSKTSSLYEDLMNHYEGKG